MFRPSSLGAASTLAKVCTDSATWSRIFLPRSGWLISRPLNMIVIFTLCPSPKKRATCRVLVSKSPAPIFGRYFISLMLVLVDLRRDSLARWAVSYLKRLKSMIRHTGGRASAATSTRSRSNFLAIERASGRALTPSCLPSGSMSKTSRARILSLIRCSLWSGAAAMRHHSFESNKPSLPDAKKGGRQEATPAYGGRYYPTYHSPAPECPPVRLVAGWGPAAPLPFVVLFHRRVAQ